MRLLISILVLAVIVSVTSAASAGTVISPSELSGELTPFLSASAGGASVTVERAYYRKSIDGRTAPDGSLFVVVEMKFRSMSDSPIIPAEKIDLRVEDAAGSIDGWPVDWETTALLDKPAGFWHSPLDSGIAVRALAAFAVPVATKGLWLRIESKINASPEKVYSGGMRGRLGDLPGDEAVRTPKPGAYRAIIGSYWNKTYADMFAASARRNGFNAWIEQVSQPQGMYVVVVFSNHDRREVAWAAENARQQGYSDAYVISPPPGDR